MQVAHPRHRAGACTLNAVGLLPVSRAWRCEGRPPLPHHFVCVETFTLPYLTLVVKLVLNHIAASCPMPPRVLAAHVIKSQFLASHAAALAFRFVASAYFFSI